MHGIYADARLPADHELRCRAALLRLPPGTTLAGRSAAWLHGVEHAARYEDDVEVIAPHGVRIAASSGLRVHHVPVRPGEITETPSLRHTTAARTAWDLAQWLDPLDAVPIVDSLLRLVAVDLDELAALLATRVRERGNRRARRVFELADGGAQSVPESRLRVHLMLARLPRPVTQHPVRLRSGVLLHPDLAWPEYRVAAEYDGEWHAGPDQLHLDRRQLNALVSEGWLVLHVTSRRMRQIGTVVTEVRDALRSRGWRPRRPLTPAPDLDPSGRDEGKARPGYHPGPQSETQRGPGSRHGP